MLELNIMPIINWTTQSVQRRKVATILKAAVNKTVAANNEVASNKKMLQLKNCCK